MSSELASFALEVLSLTSHHTDSTSGKDVVECVPEAGCVLATAEAAEASSGKRRTKAAREADPASLSFYPLVRSLGVPIVQLSAGFKHVLMRTSTGVLFGQGNNSFGQLAPSTSSSRGVASHYDTPVLMFPPPGSSESSVVDCAAGTQHSCAVTKDGRILTAGNGSHGQLGREGSDKQLLPAPVPGNPQIVACAAGNDHTVVLDREGQLYSVGRGDEGQLGLGDGSRFDVLSFTKIPVPPTRDGAPRAFVAIDAGQLFTLALERRPDLADGDRVWSCGSNTMGETGRGHDVSVNVSSTLRPIRDHAFGRIRQLFAGWKHAGVVLADGTLQVWGCNRQGECGLGWPGGANGRSVVSGQSKLSSRPSSTRSSGRSARSRSNSGTPSLTDETDATPTMGDSLLVPSWDAVKSRSSPASLSPRSVEQVRADLSPPSSSKGIGAIGSDGNGSDVDDLVSDMLDDLVVVQRSKTAQRNAVSQPGSRRRNVGPGRSSATGGDEASVAVPKVAVVVEENLERAMWARDDGTEGTKRKLAHPVVWRPRTVEGPLAGVRVVAAAGGWKHTVVVTESGDVWTTGANQYAQLGAPATVPWSYARPATYVDYQRDDSSVVPTPLSDEELLRGLADRVDERALRLPESEVSLPSLPALPSFGVPQAVAGPPPDDASAGPADAPRATRFFFAQVSTGTPSATATGAVAASGNGTFVAMAGPEANPLVLDLQLLWEGGALVDTQLVTRSGDSVLVHASMLLGRAPRIADALQVNVATVAGRRIPWHYVVDTDSLIVLQLLADYLYSDTLDSPPDGSLWPVAEMKALEALATRLGLVRLAELADRARLVAASSNSGDGRLPPVSPSTLIADLSGLLENDDARFDCVIFHVGDRELAAHRAILAARVPGLCEELGVDLYDDEALGESGDGEDGETVAQVVFVEDEVGPTDPAHFAVLLEFAYTGRISVTSADEVLPLLRLAHRLHVGPVVDRCVDLLIFPHPLSPVDRRHAEPPVPLVGAVDAPWLGDLANAIGRPRLARYAAAMCRAYGWHVPGSVRAVLQMAKEEEEEEEENESDEDMDESDGGSRRGSRVRLPVPRRRSRRRSSSGGGGEDDGSSGGSRLSVSPRSVLAKVGDTLRSRFV